MQQEKEFDGYYIIECPAEEMNLIQAHFICKFKPFYNTTLPPQEMFKSFAQLKAILGTGLREIKKFIRLKDIKDYNGFYKVSDFAKF